MSTLFIIQTSILGPEHEFKNVIFTRDHESNIKCLFISFEEKKIMNDY
jgi:hypothetical protein